MALRIHTAIIVFLIILLFTGYDGLIFFFAPFLILDYIKLIYSPRREISFLSSAKQKIQKENFKLLVFIFPRSPSLVRILKKISLALEIYYATRTVLPFNDKFEFSNINHQSRGSDSLSLTTDPSYRSYSHNIYNPYYNKK